MSKIKKAFESYLEESKTQFDSNHNPFTAFKAGWEYCEDAEKQALDLATVSQQGELVCDYCGHKEPDLMGFVLTCNNCIKQKQTGG